MPDGRRRSVKGQLIDAMCVFLLTVMSNLFSTSFVALLGATVTIAFLHSLAPDHWLPFVMIAKARKWSRQKVALVSFVAGLGHVGSSVVLGIVGIVLGLVATMNDLESTRARLGLFLLIGFGITYAIWGIRHSRAHHHRDGTESMLDRKTVTLWSIFAVFVLGPCEPLIPLMFLATVYGSVGIVTVTIVFSVVTVPMMITQALIGHAGIQLVSHSFVERYTHTLAGVVIALTGFILFLLP